MLLRRTGHLVTALGVMVLIMAGEGAEAALDRWSRVGARGANIRSIAIDPTDQTKVYAAARNDGIYRSASRGEAWAQSNTGLDFIAAWSVSVDPQTPSVVWAATEIGGAYRSTDSGKTWSHTRAGATDGVADYPTNVPAQISSDDLGSWTDAAPDKANRGGMWGYPIDQCVSDQAQAGAGTRCAARADWPVGGFDLRDPDIDAATPGDQPAPAPYPKTIFRFQFGSDVVALPGGALLGAFRGSNHTIGGGLFRTADSGSTWRMTLRRSDGTPLAGQTSSPTLTSTTGFNAAANLWRVRVGASDPSRVYLASTEGIWRSSDGGTTWAGNEPVGIGEFPCQDVNLACGFGPLEVRGLAVDHTNADIVYAGTWAGGVHRSTDGGATFTASSNGLPEGAGIWDVALNPKNPKNLFAAVFWHGVYQSNDSGVSWAPFNAGFDDDTIKQVYALAIDPASGGGAQNLYAGTIDGIWAISSEGFGKSSSLASTGPGAGLTASGGLLLVLGFWLGRFLRAGDENRTRA